MSFLLRASATSALRACRGMAPRVYTTALKSMPTFNRSAIQIARQTRFYSDKKDKKYSSILNDDMLEKAGMDTDKATSKDSSKEASAKKDKEGKKEDSESQDDDEFTRTRKRRNNTKSTLDKKKDRYAKLFWYSALGGGVAFGIYMMRDWDEKEEPELYNKDENGYTAGKMLKRLKKRVSGVSGVFNEPAFNDLLPPPPPEPYRHPLTLVLELDDTLVHASWNHAKGWRTAKRSGVDYFLGYLSQYYEIVVFSKSSMAFAENTVNKLDPYHAYISYSLYNEVCRVKDGKMTKDLSMMNRPMGKMIMIDPHKDCYSLQPENNIPLDPWNGTKDDKLIALIPFLEYVATQPVKDVRPILASFDDKKNIPTEFAWREHKLREEWEKEQKTKSENSWLTKLLGVPASLGYQRKMPLDVIREAGQKNYQSMTKYLKENGDKMLKEEEEKTKELMAKQNLTLGKIVTEGMPTAEDIAKQQSEQATTASTTPKTQ